MPQGVILSDDAARRVADQTRLGEGGLIVSEPLQLPDRPPVYFYRTFQLTEDLPLGGSAAVNWMVWNVIDEEYQADGTDTGTVVDTLGTFCAGVGCKGRAGYLGTNDGHLWEVLHMSRLTVAFALKDALTSLADAPVLAYRRVWDPTLHSGHGGFTVDCDKEIYVADWREVGYYGEIGAHGAAEPRNCDNGVVHVICDLCCSGDEDPQCGE